MMQDTYMETMQAIFAAMSTDTADGDRVRYRIVDISPRKFELKYANVDIDGYCSFTVSLRVIGHHRTVKVVAHAYDGTKLSVTTYKDLSELEAVTAINILAVHLYEKAITDRRNVAEFRSTAIAGFGSLGYSTQCSSRYMLGFATKKKSIIITMSADGHFTADLKYTHSHSGAREQNVYRATGEISAISAKKLIETFENI